MWVPLIENNEYQSEGAEYFVKKNIQNLLEKEPRIDNVVLGCTHYPLLTPTIRKYLPESIEIIPQGEIVARSLKDYLMRHPEIDRKCTRNSVTDYFTTESPEKFMSSASIFLQQNIKAIHLIL